MKIVSPNDEDHQITLIPRNNEQQGIILDIINDATKEVTTLNSTFTNFVSYNYLDGIGYLDVTFNFEDKQKYTIKVYCSLNQDNVIYRGNVLSTTQETQDYKQTKDLYFYE